MSSPGLGDLSLSSFIRPIAAEAHVTAAAFLGETAAFALGDGAILLSAGENLSRIEAHPGAAILVAAANGTHLLTGGDDGRLVRTSSTGRVEELATTEKGAWIDAVAIGPDGAVAWAAARSAHVLDGRGANFSLALPSSARGVAFAPKGFQLYVARYNGLSLWMPRLKSAPKELLWKGSHLGVTASADGRFVVSAMQENELHGWRVADSTNMRMSGYPSKTRSMSWSHDGKWLATSGADAVIVWPFVTKDGPMGKPPLELGVRASRVEQVAFHPRAPVLAAGYRDGCVLLIRTEDDNILQARPAGEGGPVSALAWNPSGTALAFGTEGGAAGLLPLPRM